MKKLYILAFVAAFCSIAAKGYFIPPEFVETEWTYVGDGVYHPGLMDWSESEITYPLDTKVYASVSGNGDYWIEPDTTPVVKEDNDENGQHTEMAPTRGFIIHAADKDKVYLDPIAWPVPLVGLEFRQRVPEIFGIDGSAAYYGHWDADNQITFPAEAFLCTLDKTPTNKNGQFLIEMPDMSGISAVSADTNAAAVYYNLQGLRVIAPQPGQLYIERRGGKTAKVIF